ncbi:IclR family transcriptional regulator [Cupriavidus basilensis]|uniref:IclR family transcriptional regulator n=1 Tax=Cupriavidus basilensis TaxID=68895 RepID=UPI0007519561|nr:IclR family transcriptional regulator [Cupriavidus basilensis]
MAQARPLAKDRQFVAALARGIQVLQCFSAARPELSGSEIAKLTGIPQPTVWRLCHTLLETGMLIVVAGERYRPGLPVLRLGYSAISGMSLVELARPHMQEIATRYGAACGLATRDGNRMVFVERCEGNNQLLMNLRVGSAVPLATSALGWAYVAGLPTAQRRQLLDELRTQDRATMTEVSRAMNKALADYDRLGYVLNEGVFHKAYTTVAVPVVAADGSIPYTLNCGSAAISISVAEHRNVIAPKLIALARMLENALEIRS